MPEHASSTVQAEARRLTAIMFTDMVGFSRQMGADEARTLRALEVHNHIIQQAVAAHHGYVIKSTGDGFLVDFPSVVNAVQCAQQIQDQFRAHNVEKAPAEQIHVRIGIHSGDIVQRDGDVFGDGVNIAARLQELAAPDTICISHKVYEEVEKKLALGTVVALGRPKLKNIAQRQPVYALLSEQPKGFRQNLRVQRLKLSRRVGTAHRVGLLIGLLLITGGIATLLFPPHSLFRIPQSELRNQEALPLPDKPSIVVLPFVNMSNDTEQAYFSDGITEDITADLSKISSLFVIARNSAFSYKGRSPKVQDVSRELGVRYALEGSVRKAGEQVRITAQLIDATTGGHLWSERYDRPLQDLFALQDEIRQKIVTALKVKLTQEEQERFRRAPTDNLEAYDYYLRGLEHFWRGTKEANAQARQMYEKALALDPHYAGAEAMLGFTYFAEWIFQWSQDPQTLERAFELAQRAVTLDDALPLAHGILGRVYQHKNQHDQAIAEGERAVALDPNNAESHMRLALILSTSGRAEDAIESAKKAMRLNPHYPPRYISALGYAYHQAWHNEEAITTMKRYLVYNPNDLGTHLMLACSYSDIGRYEEARAAVAEVLLINPNFSTEVWKKNQWTKDPAELERHINNLRKAGLK
ncbi:MAG TPA: tetratricopeptide repeat protein [Candidatus Binatia bacterium]|jgi:TolB-like protein/class 3 adenylate cyclase|nr:tetratricopeptide repeat protein [Candidatus Binatia bacterium]